MPSLADHASSKFVKILYIGDSGTGKTGSLTSLVKAGYKIRILDFDNGVDTLAQYVKQECPDKLRNVDYETVRDNYKSDPVRGPVVAGTPKAFTSGMALMTKWSDGSIPSEWGEDTIFVLDSLSAFGKAAFAWAKGMNAMSPKPNPDMRALYGVAQSGLEDTIALLTSEQFKANVIVISHVNYKEIVEGTTKGYANAIGTALGPVLPRYFNTLVMAESVGSGKAVQRTIKTVPTGIVDLKSPVTFKLDASLPLSTGLATLFVKLKEADMTTTETKELSNA
jgi:hypothetical protein